MKRACIASALMLCLAACAGNPQQLPVGVSVCSAIPAARGFDVVATVENKGEKPISRMDVSAAFYQDFRYRRFSGSAQLARELDPGASAQVTFAIADSAQRVRGQAIRCFVTHIGYLDGTSQDAPAQ